jgi:hypothetical protein
MLLRWARIMVLRRTGAAIVARMAMIVVVTMIKISPRGSNSISRAAAAILVAVWLVVIHTVSNRSADLVVAPAAVASTGDTATHNNCPQRRHQHGDIPAGWNARLATDAYLLTGAHLAGDAHIPTCAHFGSGTGLLTGAHLATATCFESVAVHSSRPKGAPAGSATTAIIPPWRSSCGWISIRPPRDSTFAAV